MDKEDRRPKKPKSGPSRFARLGYKIPATNGTSPSMSRPVPNLERTAQKADANDIVNYMAVDRRVDEVGYRKTFAPNLVSLRPDGPNKGHPGEKQAKAPKVKKERCVHLIDVYSGLWLGNLQYARSLESCIYEHIINLSEVPLKKVGTQKVYNINISDDHNQNYHYFVKTMREVVDIMTEAISRNQTILINCAAGVNRSVSAVIAYCLMEKDWSIDETVDYLEKSKIEQGYQAWDTLTNGSFRNYLRLMKSS